MLLHFATIWHTLKTLSSLTPHRLCDAFTQQKSILNGPRALRGKRAPCLGRSTVRGRQGKKHQSSTAGCQGHTTDLKCSGLGKISWELRVLIEEPQWCQLF